MPTPQKEAAVARLRERLAASANVIFTNPSGLTVAEITALRNELRKEGGSYAVVKNTLFKIAAGDDLAARIGHVLNGPTAVVFGGDDPVAPAKVLKKFSDTVKPLPVKAAVIDGKLADAREVELLASLPSRPELIAKLVGSLASPLRGLVTVLSGNQRGLVRVLDAIREQKLAQTAS